MVKECNKCIIIPNKKKIIFMIYNIVIPPMFIISKVFIKDNINRHYEKKVTNVISFMTFYI